MSTLVGNPEDRFSRDKADTGHILSEEMTLRCYGILNLATS